jgi:hypothetical protein
MCDKFRRILKRVGGGHSKEMKRGAVHCKKNTSKVLYKCHEMFECSLCRRIFAAECRHIAKK